jgi:acetoin utilization deacetylase AcuC-like enzyme
MSPQKLRAVWSPAYEVDIGAHVFPTEKYRRVKEELVRDGTLTPDSIRHPEPADWESVARVHSRAYLDRIKEGTLTREEERRLELPFSTALREASLLNCGGTLETGRWALGEGMAVHLGGGFHHAFADHGEGFCLLNDVAVAGAELRARQEVERVAIVDLDVHHGNGTAAIFCQEPQVFTFSMHQEANYPFLKPAGDLDVGLEDGVDDEAYLDLLERHLPTVLDGHGPQLVFYLAGADPYREDQLGGLALSMNGLRLRDRTVFRECRARGIPVATVLAGGYARRLADTVRIHGNTVREARTLL